MLQTVFGGRGAWARRTLVTLGTVAALSAGLANPAEARSGTWSSDVWYVRWSAGITYTQIEPHMFAKAAAVIGRYTGSGPTYYYGPYKTNNAVTHNTSRIYATTGSYIGNYFAHQGSLFRI